jgi:ribosome recycling factor
VASIKDSIQVMTDDMISELDGIVAKKETDLMAH